MSTALLRAAERAFQEKDILLIEEVAQFMRLPPEAVYNWTRRVEPERRLEKYTIGRAVRIAKDDFIRWLGQEYCRREGKVG